MNTKKIIGFGMRKLIFAVTVLFVLAFTALAFASCKHDPDLGNGPGNNPGGGTLITPPSVGELPAFPANSTPAATRADAETILKELRQTRLIEDLWDEIREVVDENRPDNDGNYSFSDKSLPNGNVRVSGSGTENVTSTGGFKASDDLWNLYDDPGEHTWEEWEEFKAELNKIQYARNDRYDNTFTDDTKGEVTKAKTEGSITIMQGSTFEEQEKGSRNTTVTTAGNYTTFRISGTGSDKVQEVAAFTVTTSRGSVKVILDASVEWSGTANNALYGGDDGEGIEEYETYSGSLKVYGSSNALLINHQIVDEASCNMAYYMIEYDQYPFDSIGAASATPLTANTIATGTIDYDTPDWYSINVTNEQTYHLWWSDKNISRKVVPYPPYDFRFRGYTSDGNAFFDKGIENYHSFTATSTGTVYIMVYVYGGESPFRTYTIAYNTTGNQPSSMRSASVIAPVSPFGDSPSGRERGSDKHHFRPKTSKNRLFYGIFGHFGSAGHPAGSSGHPAGGTRSASYDTVTEFA